MSQSASRSRRSRPRASVLFGAGLASLLLVGGCDDGPSGSGRTVSRVVVSAPATSVEVGGTLQLTAVAFDRRDRQLTGRSFAWTSSSDAVAGVSADGLVTGRAGGPVTITATAEGVPGTLALTVAQQPAARVAVAPAFATVDAGGTATLRAAALTAAGDTVRGAEIAWSATPGTVATVGATGVVTGAAEGQARVVARSGTLADTATVAVLGPRTLLSTAFPGTSLRADIAAGQTFTVPVVLDLSKVGSNGDLGAAQFDLVFDPAVLQFDGAASTLQGAAETNLAAPGRVRFAFAATAPQGSARLTLATLTFRVAPGAAAGTQTALDLTYTAAPTSTGFAAYDLPVAVDGRVRVAP
ncbi:MAG TPA: Ig-like domain-containing protein [Longimicrobiaceae bacterium]|nr:Ig-like domain-containing protein [Longimicrobiaceae bacterium]